MRNHPLIAAWLALLALTFVAGAIADVGDHTRLGPFAIAAIAIAIVAKTRLILRCYLRLDAFPGLLNGFGLSAAAIVIMVSASLCFLS